MAEFDPTAAARRFAELEATREMASVDPSYDTRRILWLMEMERRRNLRRVAPKIDMGARQEQYEIDHPEESQEPEPYRPLPRVPR